MRKIVLQHNLHDPDEPVSVKKVPSLGWSGQAHHGREMTRSTHADMDAVSAYCSSSGHGTMVDFTVFMASASATARAIPSSEKGYSVCISSQGYRWRVR